MDWDKIADPTANSVLELLVRDEPPTAEEQAAAERCRAARVRRQLDALAGSLRDERWNQSTTGVGLLRVLADLIDGSRDCPEALHAFVRETIDGKRNAFRPYRLSQYVKAKHGLGISNHTVQKTLGKVAEVGGPGGNAAEGAPRSYGRRAAADGVMRRDRSHHSNERSLPRTARPSRLIVARASASGPTFGDTGGTPVRRLRHARSAIIRGLRRTRRPRH